MQSGLKKQRRARAEPATTNCVKASIPVSPNLRKPQDFLMPNNCGVLYFTAIVFLSTFAGFAQQIEAPADAVQSSPVAPASDAPAQQSALPREIMDPLRQFLNALWQPAPASSGT